MKKTYTTIISLSALLLVSGMQTGTAQVNELLLPGSHRYMLDNPAAAGGDLHHHIYLGTYKKWFNLDQAPTTFYLASAHPFLTRGFGIGGIIVHDQAGLINTTRFGLHAAVHLTPDSDHQFSIGAAARYQLLNYDMPNVEDIVGGVSASDITLGFGLNYHYKIDRSSFFNLYGYFTRLPSTVQLVAESTNQSPLEYGLSENLVVQANLRLAIGEGLAMTPSVRFQAQPSNGYLNKTQIIDAAIGFSIMNDALQFRIGGRTGDSKIIYGGVGVRLFDKMNAHVFVEPTGPLGTSAAFDAELNLASGISDSLPPDPVEERSDYYLYKDKLQDRLTDRRIGPVIKADSYYNPLLRQRRIEYIFPDRVDAYINFFNHPEMLAQVPLDQLIDELEVIAEELKKDRKNPQPIMNFVVKVKNDLNAATFETYSGFPIEMDFWENGSLVQDRVIREGNPLTERDLALLKLRFLRDNMVRLVPAFRDFESRFEVIRGPGFGDNRQVTFGFILKRER